MKRPQVRGTSRKWSVERRAPERRRAGFARLPSAPDSRLSILDSRLLHRRGSVLVIVLVVVVLLALAAYNYSQLMLTEMEAASMYTSDAQARAMCDSGAEYVATLLANRTQPGLENMQHNPLLFQGINVVDSGHARGRGRFSILAPVEHDVAASTVRYGLMDESAKINLNSLSKVFKNSSDPDTDMHTLLMKVPGMTDEIADAILDWVDADDNSRQSGAEAEYYQGMSLPYSCKNGPLETIDELLLVRGVTPELLYGEDANRNGLLDPNENDGQASPPLDNADGVLHVGWISFFTVGSREANRRKDGKKKININSGVLTDVYDQVQEELGEDAANFIIQYRLAGPVSSPLPADPNSTSSGGGSSGGSSSGSSKSGGSSGQSLKSLSSASNSGQSLSQSSGGSKSSSGGSSSGGSKGSSGGSSKGSSGGSSKGGSGGSSGSSGSSGASGSGLKQLANAAGQAMSAGLGGTVTRGQYNLTAGGQTTINSLWELFDSTAKAAPKAGGGQTAKMTSPYASTNTADIPKLLDMLSLTDNDFLEGRINVNQARPEILAGIPYMTDQMVQAITAAQQSANDASSSAAAEHSTTFWLLTEGVVPDIQTLNALDPYLTARGDVYRAQILGFYDGGGPVARMEVIVDGTQQPPRVVFFRDLNDLGRGYTRMQLLTPAMTR